MEIFFKLPIGSYPGTQVGELNLLSNLFVELTSGWVEEGDFTVRGYRGDLNQPDFSHIPERQSRRDDFDLMRFFGQFGDQTVAVIGVLAGSLLAGVKLLKALSPIIEKYVEKRAGRSVTIKVDGVEINVENRRDLDMAIQKAKELMDRGNEEQDGSNKPRKATGKHKISRK